VTLPSEADAPPSSLERVRALAASRTAALEALALALAVAIILASVLPNLANHPTLTDDEAWVMSASYKLAHEGVFGTDMFRDFYGADRHYFFNMPGYHFAVALSFKLFGAGVVQARLVGVLYGLATIGLTYILARRLYGVAAAIGPDRLRALVVRRGRWVGLKESDVVRAETWFDGRGEWAVLICRCVPLVRSLVSIPAGFRHMGRTRFTVYTALGSLVWNTALIVLGYEAAAHQEAVADLIGQVQYVVVAALVGAVGWFLWRRRHRIKDSVGEARSR
jgi:membrane protein DedA with SNARE-associated domain